MKISVAMATYNGAQYLSEQLDSLRNQSMLIDEVVICDDKSSDNTVIMLREYIKNYQLEDRWSIYENEQNLGYANNFHKALQLTTGDYIFFCDQDDIWALEKIEKIVKVMEEHIEIQLLCTDYEPFISATNAPTVPSKVMQKMRNDSSLEKIELNYKNIYIASLGCDMCIRKTFRDQIEPYWVNGWAHDDFVWKTAQCVDGCYEYHEALLKRRLHANNVSMKKMHGKDVRVRFLKELAEANAGMLDFARSVNLKQSKVHFIERTIRALKMREDVVENCKISNCIKLLAYIDCYQSKKSILMEPYIALKNRLKVTCLRN